MAHSHRRVDSIAPPNTVSTIVVIYIVSLSFLVSSWLAPWPVVKILVTASDCLISQAVFYYQDT